jgi:hypothetical protein
MSSCDVIVLPLSGCDAAESGSPTGDAGLSPAASSFRLRLRRSPNAAMIAAAIRQSPAVRTAT